MTKLLVEKRRLLRRQGTHNYFSFLDFFPFGIYFFSCFWFYFSCAKRSTNVVTTILGSKITLTIGLCLERLAMDGTNVQEIF